jgi:hypothetical protein
VIDPAPLVSASPSINVWADPVPEFGLTDTADGTPPDPSTVHQPKLWNPLVGPEASFTTSHILFAPAKPPLKLNATLTVILFPLIAADELAGFSVH